MRREVKMDKCPKSEVELGVQRYPPEWEKMDTCPIVELGVLGAHMKKKKKREILKKRNKKMIAHGPFHKQYASKRCQTFQKGQRS